MSKKITSAFQGSDHAYAKYYADHEWNAFRRRDAMRYMRYLGDRIAFEKNDKILEVGCGTAEFGSIIRDQHGSSIYGLDMNTVAVKQAKKNGIHAYVHDIERKWPFSDKMFRCVIATQIIEHIVNPDFMITESKRVLQSGGYLIIATPNLGAWFNRVIVPLGYQPFFTEVSTVDKTFGLGFTRKLTAVRTPLGHLRCFTLAALKDILEYYGFQIIFTKGATVSYLPSYVSLLDGFFSKFPSMATDLLIVARCR